MIVLGFLIIFAATTLGSAGVFFIKGNLSKLKIISYGLSSGIMVAASIWSLILPAIDGQSINAPIKIVPVIIGLAVGGLFMSLLELFLPSQNGVINRSMKLFIAVTMHNIPEGLAVGFAFSAAEYSGTGLIGALMFAIGIAIQNIPEGFAVALPFSEAKNRRKAFLFGAASGIVEPIAAFIGYFLAASLILLQPFLLAFAAGAMIFVPLYDLLPETKDAPMLGTWMFLIGFILMMTLDVVLN